MNKGKLTNMEKFNELMDESLAKTKEFSFYWNQYLEYDSRFSERTRDEIVEDLIEQIGCRTEISKIKLTMQKDNFIDKIVLDEGSTSIDESILKMLVHSNKELEPFLEEMKEKVQTQYMEDVKYKNLPENEYLN